MTILKDLHHVPDISWDKITAPLQLVQCQKLQCALKLLKKTEEHPFLCQPIPTNNIIETEKHNIEEEKLHAKYEGSGNKSMKPYLKMGDNFKKMDEVFVRVTTQNKKKVYIINMKENSGDEE